MSDAFFEKVFGDSQPGNFGTGWISGTLSVFLGVLGLGGAVVLHFPGLLTLPDARAVYPTATMLGLTQAVIALASVLAPSQDCSGSAKCWPSPASRSDWWRRSS